MTDASQRRRFEEAVLPHLDAAYNLARWLTGKDHDAEDVVQEACCRAFRALDGYRGGDGRAWLLTIVRNVSYTWLQQRARHAALSFEEEDHDPVSEELNPERLLLRQAERQLLREAIAALPVEFREVIVLRELEGLSYQQIATIASIPLGTVMSRLARGRGQLHERLAACMDRGELQ
ncbi:MAG TPA: sigma-70 family RNA polymerase sigma factor [Gemmataceae bacterium]|nr:sigma-70 family RNA polymerase sigma factor [Gemmataceae bacterium]